MTNRTKYLAHKRRIIRFIRQERLTILGIVCVNIIWITAFSLGVM